MPKLVTDPCPCGAAQRYADCCGRYHAGPEQLRAPDAESLMRSRYCAYVLQLGEYLLATWHPSTRPASPMKFEAGLRWLGLQVLRHEAVDADRARVEFVARSKLGGRAHRHHELSRFVREAGRWLYVEAVNDAGLR
jgi:SEC-C motif-containing protein